MSLRLDGQVFVTVTVDPSESKNLRIQYIRAWITAGRWALDTIYFPPDCPEYIRRNDRINTVPGEAIVTAVRYYLKEKFENTTKI